MTTTWSNSLKTGLEWQDAQHRELIDEMDLLLNSMETGASREALVEIFYFLDSYVIHHFGEEKTAMEKARYPELGLHLLEHTIFITSLVELKSDLSKNDVSPELKAKTKDQLIDWFVKHIGQVDKKLGAFLITNGLEEA